MSLDDLLDNYASKGGAPRLRSEFRGGPTVPTPPTPVVAPAPTPAQAQAPTPPLIPTAPVLDDNAVNVSEYLEDWVRGRSRASFKTCHQFDFKPYASLDMGEFVFSMYPQRIFRPQGITVFCSTYCELSLDIGQVRIFTNITGEFFRNQIPYTDLVQRVQALQAGGGYTTDIPMSTVLEHGIARFQPTFRTCEPGHMITLHVNGAVPEAVVLWGDSL